MDERFELREALGAKGGSSARFPPTPGAFVSVDTVHDRVEAEQCFVSVHVFILPDLFATQTYHAG